LATEDPALRFLAGDGRAVEPQRFDGWQCLALPDDTAVLSITSRQAVPAEFDAEGTDCRPLGVALTGLRLDGEWVGLEDARLLGGWHAAEPGLRWTDGAGKLDVSGCSIVELRFAAIALRYPLPHRPAVQPAAMMERLRVPA
jgi:hypothetical protein